MVWVYNTTKNSAIGLSPYEILQGLPATMPEDVKSLPLAPETEIGTHMAIGCEAVMKND